MITKVIVSCFCSSCHRLAADSTTELVARRLSGSRYATSAEESFDRRTWGLVVGSPNRDWLLFRLRSSAGGEPDRGAGVPKTISDCWMEKRWYLSNSPCFVLSGRFCSRQPVSCWPQSKRLWFPGTLGSLCKTLWALCDPLELSSSYRCRLDKCKWIYNCKTKN